VPTRTFLFCFDVPKLYHSIPKMEGLEACAEGLRKRTTPLIPTDEAIEMAGLVLENNNFSFNGKHYVQTDGTAICSRLGKNFACCYMRKWEEQLNSSEVQPLFYKRFIDDDVGLWPHGKLRFKEFEQFMNGIQHNIKVGIKETDKEI